MKLTCVECNRLCLQNGREKNKALFRYAAPENEYNRAGWIDRCFTASVMRAVSSASDDMPLCGLYVTFPTLKLFQVPTLPMNCISFKFCSHTWLHSINSIHFPVHSLLLLLLTSCFIDIFFPPSRDFKDLLGSQGRRGRGGLG